jgi:hypothetical protein
MSTDFCDEVSSAEFAKVGRAMPESLLGVERIVFVFDAQNPSISKLAQVGYVFALSDLAVEPGIA